MQNSVEYHTFNVEPSIKISDFKALYVAIEPRCDPEDVSLIFNGESMLMNQKDKPEKDLLSGYGIVAGEKYKLLMIWKDSDIAKNPEKKKKK